MISANKRFFLFKKMFIKYNDKYSSVIQLLYFYGYTVLITDLTLNMTRHELVTQNYYKKCLAVKLNEKNDRINCINVFQLN